MLLPPGLNCFRLIPIRAELSQAHFYQAWIVPGSFLPGLNCPRFIPTPSTQTCRKWCPDSVWGQGAGFPSAHSHGSPCPGPSPRAAPVQSSVPGEIILPQEHRVEPVNGPGDVGEVPAVRVSDARAWKTNLGFALHERKIWALKSDPPFPRREEKSKW